ncbi:uncharacterized protein [Ambystoma mexicanum]|uniref:uncharacterized protein n=1 Tax=Ambystoma mexicanum TaxID=8296 RepID=UPI0037E8F66A
MEGHVFPGDTALSLNGNSGEAPRPRGPKATRATTNTLPTGEPPLYALSEGNTDKIMSRKRRSSNYISKASSEFLAQIPDRYRLFSSAESFFTSLIPSIHARANAKWLQITWWELIQLANDTEEGFNMIKVELRALGLMTMQNRYVLDLLTAMDGGVCRKFGSACCTFVPSEDADNETLSHVIAAVHNLGERMKTEGGTNLSTWFDNLFSWVPSWMGLTVKLLMPLIVFLPVIFCVCQLGLRCCANAVPNGAMMMVTMGNAGGRARGQQEAHIQTGEVSESKYRMVPKYYDRDIVDRLYHATIKEPRELHGGMGGPGGRYGMYKYDLRP